MNSSITDKDIAEYKRIYKSKYNKDIDDTEARKQLVSLVTMMEIVYQPITKKQANAVNKNISRGTS